ncbi:cytochrome P450 [Hypoxylon sp. FL1857]|nr:cytochrome P450 [Hypoxylon sp. FL1857]
MNLHIADNAAVDAWNGTSTKDAVLPLLPSPPQPLDNLLNRHAVLACILLLVPGIIYSITAWRFHQASKIRTGTWKSPLDPPVLPYWDVLLGHFFDLVWDMKGVFDRAVKLASHGPVEIKAAVVDFIVVSNSTQVQKLFRACGHFTNKHMAVVALQNLLGASKDVAALFESHEVDAATSDTSNVGDSEEEGHLKDHVSGFGAYARQYLSGPYLEALLERYLVNLKDNTQSLDIHDEWVQFSDLYAFLQGLVTSATIEALMGSKIFEVNPNIVDDFWTFERGTPQFLRCIPRWFMPNRYKARDRIFNTVKKLEELASQNISRFKSEDPAWEPYLGSRFLRARHEYGRFLKPLPDNTKAWEKMGILFAATSNLLPSMFWYIFESLKDQDLQQRMIAEIQSCASPDSSDVGQNIASLLKKPLLQSAYAETLRLRVAIALPRTCEHDDFDLSGHRIKKDKLLIVLTWPVPEDEAAWIQSGRPPSKKGLDEFWAERFLIPKRGTANDNCGKGDMSDYEFSLRGLSGRFMPYGGGQHLCPGRHYAKSQLIGTLAFLLSQYELELSYPSKSKEVKPDMRWFPTGSLPPNKKVPFRIRRAQTKRS